MRNDLSVAGTIAPSYGFFSNQEKLTLKIKVNKRITQAMLTIRPKGKCFINLSGLNFFNNEGNKLTDVESFSHVTSSTSKNEKSPSSLLVGNGFHSKLEKEPKWDIKFSSVEDISYIEVVNRGDYWGIRSRDIIISVVDEFGGYLEVYNIKSSDQVESFFCNMYSYWGLNVENIIESYRSLEYFRTHFIIPFLLERLNNVDVTNDELLFSLQFLPIWCQNKDPSESEIKLLVKILYLLYGHSLKIPVKPFSNMLRTADNINFFVQCLNELRHELGYSEVMLTKHGLATQGKLIKQKHKSIQAITRISEELSVLGYSAMLSYGTLLGAYRNSSFMDFDDDIDLIIKLDATSRSAVIDEMSILSERLMDRGYRIGGINDHLNRHFIDTELNVVIDLFPCWLEEEKIMLHMEKMKIRGIDSNIFSGTSSVVLHGREFLAPKLPELFLHERYGDGWAVEDKYHEWPWQLSDKKNV